MAGKQMGKAHPDKALTSQTCKSARKGRHADGNGLYLVVDASGARRWVQRIVIRGQRRDIGLGSFGLVSLKEAREIAFANRKRAREGGDPLAERQAARAVLTFAQASRKAHEELALSWKNPKDRAAFLSTLERYVFPRFGSTPLPEVTSSDIRRAILAVRAKRPEVARKLVFRISAVFKWGVAEGMCATNPATTEALALPRIEKRPSHFRALPYSEVAGCLAAVRASDATEATKLCLEFLVLTAARSGEARAAHWDEIDLKENVWAVPADRMKMKRPHRVPLSDRAVDLLEDAKRLADGSGLVFPSSRHGKPLSDMTLSKLIRGLGFDATIHGMRSAFRTWAQERSNAPREVAEAALAHSVGDVVERSYARSDLFDRRRRLMRAWSIFLTDSETKIVRLATA